MLIQLGLTLAASESALRAAWSAVGQVQRGIQVIFQLFNPKRRPRGMELVIGEKLDVSCYAQFRYKMAATPCRYKTNRCAYKAQRDAGSA